MRSDYFEKIEDYYRNITLNEIPESVVHQAKRALMDNVGCILAAVPYCERELSFINSVLGVQPNEEGNIALTANIFKGSLLSSALELDDMTGVGASVHPGCCVIPAALAAADRYGSSGAQILKTVIFGYDLCNRFGLMATERIRELGLYGPGLIAAPCTAAVISSLMGLNSKQTKQAFSMAMSMSPICPFSAFTDGADSKLFYTGWASMLGAISAQAAAGDFSGPEHILDGGKSLKSIFTSDIAYDEPMEGSRLAAALIFKDYSACYSVHAVLTAVEKVIKKYHPDTSKINSITVYVYPYAYDLSELSKENNPVSARTNIPCCVAAMLHFKNLDPDVFSKENMRNEDVTRLAKKVRVVRAESEGEGPFAKRGCTIEIETYSGEIISERVDKAKWSREEPPDDSELKNKFMRINKNIKKEHLEILSNEILNSKEMENTEKIFNILKSAYDKRACK